MVISVYKRIEKILVTTGFLLAGIFTGAVIYSVYEGRNTLAGIFRPDYFIPVAIYASGVILLAYLLYRFLRKRIIKIVAFIISIVFGVPIGIFILYHLVGWIIYLYNWIDILVNRY